MSHRGSGHGAKLPRILPAPQPQYTGSQRNRQESDSDSIPPPGNRSQKRAKVTPVACQPCQQRKSKVRWYIPVLFVSATDKLGKVRWGAAHLYRVSHQKASGLRIRFGRGPKADDCFERADQVLEGRDSKSQGHHHRNLYVCGQGCADRSGRGHLTETELRIRC